MLELRKRILKVIPHAEEVVSYGMPAFKVSGSIVAGIKANKDYIGYYPFSGSVLKNFKKELAPYGQTKSAIHVPLEKPLPQTLLKKLINARISACAIQRGEVKLDKYEKLDANWRALNLAAPARRGLVDNKIFKISDLRRWTEEDFRAIHAMGPSAARIIKIEMKKKEKILNIRMKQIRVVQNSKLAEEELSTVVEELPQIL